MGGHVRWSEKNFSNKRTFVRLYGKFLGHSDICSFVQKNFNSDNCSNDRNFFVDELEEKYKCGKTAVFEILKKIVEAFVTTQNIDSKAKSCGPKFDKVDELAYNWFCQALAKKLPVSGPILQQKAKEFA